MSWVKRTHFECNLSFSTRLYDPVHQGWVPNWTFLSVCTGYVRISHSIVSASHELSFAQLVLLGVGFDTKKTAHQNIVSSHQKIKNRDTIFSVSKSGFSRPMGFLCTFLVRNKTDIGTANFKSMVLYGYWESVRLCRTDFTCFLKVLFSEQM